MQLQERFPDQVSAVPLNVDFDGTQGPTPVHLVAEVAAALDQRGIHLECLLSATPMEQVFEELEIFGIPATLVYDQKGNLVKAYDGEVDYDRDILPTIESLLAK